MVFIQIFVLVRVATNVDFSTKRGKNVVFGDFYGKTVEI